MADQRHVAAVCLMALGACRGGGAHDGVIVRQVLKGADILQDTAIAPRATVTVSTAPGSITTTLVADSPQAIYKQAADGARKQLESDSVRAALSRLENQRDQEQETAE
jgi:hypothetical protein